MKPESCLCGYPNEKPGKRCIPACTLGCINADCAAPNVCTCRPGYIKDPTALLGNIPLCTQGCINAQCTAPNVCTCLPGFHADSQYGRNNTCVSECPDGCPNGVCKGPNKCGCLPGFDKGIDGRCGAKCEPPERRLHWALGMCDDQILPSTTDD